MAERVVAPVATHGPESTAALAALPEPEQRERDGWHPPAVRELGLSAHPVLTSTSSSMGMVGNPLL